MKEEARRETSGAEGRDPSANDLGVFGEVPRTEEQLYAREAGIVEELAQMGETVTGDEREIGRAGEGGRDHASGRDPTIGREPNVPITGGPSLAEARAKARRISGASAPRPPEGEGFAA